MALGQAGRKPKPTTRKPNAWKPTPADALFVFKQTGDLQAKARESVAKFGGPELAAESSKKEPKTFSEAKQAGARSWTPCRRRMVVQTSRPEIAGEADAKVKADLQKQLEEAQETVRTSVQDATAYFRKALELAGREDSVDDLNIVRYFLCFLHFSADDFYDAGLLGEFVAQRYPDSSGPPVRKIAMAAYLKLYAEIRRTTRTSRSAQGHRHRQVHRQKWSDQPEAIDALNTLVPLMIKAGKLDAAEKYLNDIPPDSPKRGEAEIKTGQAMWSEYLKGMQEIRKWESGEEAKPDNVDLAAKKATLDQVKARAQKILEDGVKRMKGTGKVDESAATASLSLAQIYVDTGQADKAVTVLEDAQLGPLTLVKAGHSGRAAGGLCRRNVQIGFARVYFFAGRVGRRRHGGQEGHRSDDGDEGGDPQDQLIAIYVSLARDLEQQMKLATPEARTALSKGFETFLKQIRTTATDFSVLYWVADTFSGIAAGFDTSTQAKPVLTAEAKKYYEEALATYQTILEKVKFDDPKLKTQIQLRMAGCTGVCSNSPRPRTSTSRS